MFDLLVHGGEVLDGTGAPAFRGDVGVTAGRIAAVGRLASPPDFEGVVINAAGRYVVPGFIDAHSHADAAVLDPAVQLATLRQGVTTVVLGQDGLSYAPATPEALAFVTRYFSAINGSHPSLGDGPVTVAELLATWRRTTALNTAYLVPHGTVRFGVVGGAHRPADTGELTVMRRAVERGLEQGAAGLSTGLEYLPGRYAGVTELAELCRPAAEAGLPYVTHMRAYGSEAATGMAEAHAIGVESGVAVHVSHYHGPGEALKSMVDDGRRTGVDLTFDSYPYRRACTILAMAALPRWLDDTDLDRATDALRDPTTRARVIDDLNAQLWPRITFAHVPHPAWSWTEGRLLTAAAAEAGLDPAHLLLDVLVATRLTASGVIERPPTTDEDAVRILLRHPAHTGGSDGIFVGGHPHPRGWGAFARFLGRHVRDLGDWTWEQATIHLASHPARRFGLTDRGVIRPGMAADLAVVDPLRVGDRADYANPRELAVGVDDVIVNGVAVLRGGPAHGLAGRHAALTLPGKVSMNFREATASDHRQRAPASAEPNSVAVDWSVKGLWLPDEGIPDAHFVASGHGLFDGPFCWPVMVAKRSAIESNIATMAAYCERHGVDFAPHGKTSMAPSLFAAQLAAGAWGVTVATANQALAARRFGVPRVLLANELLDPKALRWAAAEVADGWEFLCYIDSVAGVAALADASTDGRALSVLVEMGYAGGRTGCRTVAAAAEVARAAAASGVRVAGVAGFEGMLPDVTAVATFLDTLVAAADAVAPFCPYPVILSAGGSAFFDTVVDVLGPAARRLGGRVLLRSGAVVSHDDGVYARSTPFARMPGDGSLTAALEVWAQVLSTPEEGLAILGAGKRDLSFDLGLPVPVAARARGGAVRPLPGASIDALNDQHAYLRGASVAPGELVRLGISHPCTAFDKWRVIPVVDDDYRVVDLLRTFF